MSAEAPKPLTVEHSTRWNLSFTKSGEVKLKTDVRWTLKVVDNDR